MTLERLFTKKYKSKFSNRKRSCQVETHMRNIGPQMSLPMHESHQIPSLLYAMYKLLDSLKLCKNHSYN